MIVYDCEIICAIPQKKKPKVSGVRYCGGWRDFTGMGISVIACYDYNTDDVRVFCMDNLGSFQDLIDSRKVVVGYHNWNFDDPLVEAHGIKLPDKKSYDLYKEIYAAHGYKPAQRVGGMKLGDCVQANLNDRGKLGDGAMAPILWQQGKVGTVIDYCIRDVLLTRDLLDLVIDDKFISPKTRRFLKVKKPPVMQPKHWE